MLSIYSKLKEGRLRRGRFLPPPRYSNPTPARLIPTPGELGPGRTPRQLHQQFPARPLTNVVDRADKKFAKSPLDLDLWLYASLSGCGLSAGPCEGPMETMMMNHPYQLVSRSTLHPRVLAPHVAGKHQPSAISHQPSGIC